MPKLLTALKIGSLAFAISFAVSASVDSARTSPSLCSDDQVCPELGKRLSVRWDDLPAAIEAVKARNYAASSGAGTLGTPAPSWASQGRMLSVMVYNIKGLPDTLRGDTYPDAFRVIGERLAERRRDGTAPDIVLIQEAFTSRSREIAVRSGYRHAVYGPSWENSGSNWMTRFFVGLWKAAWHHSVHFESSGLLILTDLDVESASPVAFGHSACAGTDCLANKGVVFARVRLPNSNRWVDVINTHLNSNASSGAGIRDILLAHEQQVDKIHDLIDRFSGDGDAMIVGGDFNSNPETIRYAYLLDRLNMIDANSDCLISTKTCDIDKDVDLLEFWRDNELREFFRQGDGVLLQPIRATLDFTDKVDGSPLSDHAAIEIAYRIQDERVPKLAARSAPADSSPITKARYDFAPTTRIRNEPGTSFGRWPAGVFLKSKSAVGR